MTATTGARTPFDWEAEGQRLGASLEGYAAIVVLGLDPVATGHVAVGIGRAQCDRRRVAVGDLFGESPPIQALVSSDDPHGLVDSFVYGISLNRVAHLVDGTEQLFVMPSGTDVPDYAEVLPNPRWHRLASGFREVGALLVLAVPATAPRVEDLVAATDGAVLVGEFVPRKLPVARVIASVRQPRPETESAFVPLRPPRRRRRSIAIAAALLIVAAVGAGGVWLASGSQIFGGTRSGGRKPAAASAAGRIAKTDSRAAIGAAVGAAAAPAAPAADAPPLPVAANPADSAQASAFAVELMAANTQTGAILKLQNDGKNLPVPTFSAILSQGSRWFKVIAGAYPDRTGADSLLVDLRRRHLLDARSGTVVRVPFAFLIDSGVPATAVPGMVASYANRGDPVYALRQSNGTAWLLAGAFESPEQAALYAESLRSSGKTPTFVYRKGRSF